MSGWRKTDDRAGVVLTLWRPRHIRTVDVARDLYCCPAASTHGHCRHLDAMWDAGSRLEALARGRRAAAGEAA